MAGFHDLLSYDTYAVGAVAASTAIALVLYDKRKTRRSYPPGPRGYPIVGNYFGWPKGKIWEGFTQMAKDHKTDLLHLEVFGSHVLVLSKAEPIIELLDRRSALYSDRTQGTMAIELMGADWSLGFLPYGNRWRIHRRLFHKFFNVSAVERFDPRLFKGIRDFLRRLAEFPEDFADHTRLLIGSLILSITYGIEVDSQENRFFADAQEATYSLGPALLPGAFLVDWVPSLKYFPGWLPGTGFHEIAKSAKRKLDTMRDLPFSHVKENMESGGSFSPSIVSTCLEELEESKAQGVDEDTIRDLSAGVYVGGADTPPVVLQDFILAMVLHPRVLKKAQEEIDRLLGGERLPQYSDRPNLPYVSAVFKEIIRWRPPTPLGVPHRSMQDDVYQGYFIPAGTTVIENVWAMSRDESIYPDPEAFNPERFLKGGGIDPEVQDPEKFMSGHGRRACPGKHFAIRMLFTTIACTIATFDIKKAVDEYGNEVTPDPEFNPGIIMAPYPFKADLKPRSARVMSLIRED